MENRDKIFDQFKNAAENVAPKEFASMESVWSRVEEKLDTKVLKKETKIWKKIAVAASILLCVSIGYHFFKNKNDLVIPNNQVVVNEKPAELIEGKIQEPILENKPENPDLKANINKILQKPIQTEDIIAYNDAPAGNVSSPAPIVAQSPSADAVYEKVFVEVDNTPIKKMETDNSKTHFFKTKIYVARGVKQTFEEVTKQEAVAIVEQETKKQNPLYVIDGEAVAENKNKDSKSKLDTKDIENIVILKEPLYIINGVQYSEEELFGDVPTSPYAPLDKQEITKTIILQGDEAEELYGEKGKKGVVIVTTKNGKPLKK